MSDIRVLVKKVFLEYEAPSGGVELITNEVGIILFPRLKALNVFISW